MNHIFRSLFASSSVWQSHSINNEHNYGRPATKQLKRRRLSSVQGECQHLGPQIAPLYAIAAHIIDAISIMQDESDLMIVMDLIDNELSEPYTIYTYR
jgi:hypothetical protein